VIDRWFPMIKLPLTFEQFRALPRNAAYKYEYLEGETWLTPRPKQYHALLDLWPMEENPVVEWHRERVRIRRFAADDWGELTKVFAGSFSRVQPFASLGEEDRLNASRQCLEYTRDGGDGPRIEPACFLSAREDGGNAVGAILVTLMYDVDLSDLDNARWSEPPPSDWLGRKLGRPHLTWIFVAPRFAGHGVGTALLAASARALSALGYRQLASTFLLGNESSTLWHWRNGFRLVASPGSPRQLQERIRRSDPQSP
jgi:GNAT superfamily N-acetyltransferase